MKGLSGHGGQLGERLTARHPWLSGLLMLGSGMVMGITPAPLNLWPLAWIAIAPLWLIRLQTVGQHGLKTLRWPFLWGLGYHGCALVWITHLHPLTWMGIPWVGSIAIAGFAWGFITLWGAALVMIWFGLCGVLWGFFCGVLWGALGDGAWFRSDRPSFGPSVSWRVSLSVSYRLLTAVALWCVLETLWSWGPLYWTSISYTQSPGNLWLLQWGKVSGQFAITAVLLVGNGLLAEAGYRWQAHPRPSPSQPNGAQVSYQPPGNLPGNPPGNPLSSWQPFAIAVVLWGLVVHGVGWGLSQGAIADDPAQKLMVGIIQGNIPTRIKLTPAGERQAMERYTQGYQSLADQGVDVVITPEAALPIRWPQYKTQTSLYSAIQDRGVPLWLGTFAPAPLADPASPLSWAAPLTQSLLSIDGQGETVGRYNKVKLVPLGEYIPFEPLLGKVIQRLSSMGGSLVPGDPRQTFATPFGNVVVGICYESAYGDLFRQQTAQGGQLIVTASNNDPYPPFMMIQHHAQDVMRAVESDRWAVRVTNTGISGLVDAQGTTRWLGQPDAVITQVVTAYRRQSLTPYVRWGNWLTPLLSAIAIAWTMQIAFIQRRSQ